MRRANKVKSVDGSIKILERDDLTFEAQERCNMMILSWITHILSPHIAENVFTLTLPRFFGKI